MKAKYSHKSSIKSAIRHTQELTKLSTIMEVTDRGMDATFEHPGTDLLRVTGMIVLNGYAELKFPNIYKSTKD